MGLKKYRPLTPSLRYKITTDFKEITASTPEKSLIVKTNYHQVDVTILVR